MNSVEVSDLVSNDQFTFSGNIQSTSLSSNTHYFGGRRPVAVCIEHLAPYFGSVWCTGKFISATWPFYSTPHASGISTIICWFSVKLLMIMTFPLIFLSLHLYIWAYILADGWLSSLISGYFKMSTEFSLQGVLTYSHHLTMIVCMIQLVGSQARGKYEFFGTSSFFIEIWYNNFD